MNETDEFKIEPGMLLWNDTDSWFPSRRGEMFLLIVSKFSKGRWQYLDENGETGWVTNGTIISSWCEV